MYPERITRLLSALPPANLDAVAITPGPSLVYLTGLHFHVMERPTVALFSAHTEPALILPGLEVGKAQAGSLRVNLYPYGDDPHTWIEAFRRACADLGLNGMTIGVEPERMRFLELDFLQQSAPDARFVPAGAVLTRLRIEKDESEITAMRKAVQVAERAFLAVLEMVKVGMSEQELASELTVQLLRAGSAPDLPFAPIIASGPNGANPHAFPTSRRLQAGDLVVVDWGAAVDNYFSDLTRTLAIGRIDPEWMRVAQVVAEANAAGRAAARPNIPAGQVDQAARAVIDQAGYGAFFTHRTGHGLGLEEHEAPYIFSGNPELLTPGMCFTVEPGIYLPERGGVRIEDDVVVTRDGAESLSSMPRDLFVIA
jgi:Xaa-Pro dipeptidase